MKGVQWIMIFAGAAMLSFFGGYNISVHTGTEPGYFDAVEAAGYGGGGDEKIEGVSPEMSDYYQSLMKEED